jgi:hypothetical protein
VLLAPCTSSTCVLEIQDTDTISNFPWARYFAPNLHDLASWLVRRDHREARWKLAVQHLEVGVAEACRMHFDEKIMFAALRDGSLAQLIRLVELVQNKPMSGVHNDVTLPSQFVQLASFLT